ncbi:hypothetical protein THIX_60533 [Thiomonas sp. X19]|nr:hypothetical protein THIX_60533 [Thiomonas sp. X19]
MEFINGTRRPEFSFGLPRRSAGAQLHPSGSELGVSPSALSHTVRGLETRLGLRLLTRTTRSVSPTEAGERLMRTLGPGFAEIDAELLALRELHDKPPQAPSASPPPGTPPIPCSGPGCRRCYPTIRTSRSKSRRTTA